MELGQKMNVGESRISQNVICVYCGQANGQLIPPDISYSSSHAHKQILLLNVCTHLSISVELHQEERCRLLADTVPLLLWRWKKFCTVLQEWVQNNKLDVTIFGLSLVETYQSWGSPAPKACIMVFLALNWPLFLNYSWNDYAVLKTSNNELIHVYNVY